MSHLSVRELMGGAAPAADVRVLNAICVLKAIIARAEEGTELGAQAALAAAHAHVLLEVLANIRIAPPDADGLVWVGVGGRHRQGRVAVPATSVAGQAFLDWGAQAELVAALAKGETEATR